MKLFYLFRLKVTLCTLIIVLFSGCALRVIRGLSITEVAALQGERALLRQVGLELRVAASEIAIADESAFFSQLERVRISPASTFKTPRLYIYQNGNKKYFGEIVSKNIIKLNGLNKSIAIPGEIYTVNKNLVNVRTGPGLNYSIYKQLNKDDLVMVLSKENSWAKIQLDDYATGFILVNMLAQVYTSPNEPNQIPTLFPLKQRTRIGLIDNFSDVGYSNSLWPSISNVELTCGPLEGKYIMNVHQERANWAIAQLVTIDSFIVTSEVKKIFGSSNAEYGLVFGYAGPNNFFYFTITDNSFRVGRYFGDRYIDHYNLYINNTIRPNEVNQLAIRTDKSSYLFYINNIQVCTFSSSPKLPGIFGFYASRPVYVQFDNFTLLQYDQVN